MEYTISITKEVPHIKYQIAEEKVNELVKFLSIQISNDKVSNGVSAFKEETNVFKQAVKGALEAFRDTILVVVDETYSDEQIIDLMASLEALKAQRDALLLDADVIGIEDNYNFKQIKAEIAKLKDIKDKLILAGWTV